jgi:hypothetical protein
MIFRKKIGYFGSSLLKRAGEKMNGKRNRAQDFTESGENFSWNAKICFTFPLNVVYCKGTEVL